jgi:GTP-sensing pleiotropic transcriptional regulator CodY
MGVYMYIAFSDHIGVTLVKVNEYGIDFDHDNGTAIFEDENGRDYQIKFCNIHRIAEGE